MKEAEQDMEEKIKDGKMNVIQMKRKHKKDADAKLDAQAKEFDSQLEKTDKKVKEVNKEADRKITAAKKKAAEATEKAERIAKEATQKKSDFDLESLGNMGTKKSYLSEVVKSQEPEAID
jgi:hypothetical protein